MVPETVSDVPAVRVADVAVVGGGISGLATAYWLAVEHEVDVVVLEAGDRAGGKVSTQLLAGKPVDTGPDAFLSRGQDLAELVSRVGLADDVVRPLPGGAFIWSRGRLRPIPQGGAFGIPDRVLPLVRSRLLSPAGVLRAGLDLVRPRTTLGADPTVAEVVRPRLGDQVVERIVQPLLGGRARRLGRPAQRAQHRARRRRAGPLRPLPGARPAPASPGRPEARRTAAPAARVPAWWPLEAGRRARRRASVRHGSSAGHGSPRCAAPLPAGRSTRRAGRSSRARSCWQHRRGRAPRWCRASVPSSPPSCRGSSTWTSRP